MKMYFEYEVFSDYKNTELLNEITNEKNIYEEYEKMVALRKLNIYKVWSTAPEDIPDNIIYVFQEVMNNTNGKPILKNKYNVLINDTILYNLIKNDIKSDTNFKGNTWTYKTGNFTKKIYKYYDKEITFDFSKLSTKNNFRSICNFFKIFFMN